MNEGEKPSIFDGLTIENCIIRRCERNGIIWWGYVTRDFWHPNRHVVVRNNLIEGVPGDGIVPIGCDSAVIEYNRIKIVRTCYLMENLLLEFGRGVVTTHSYSSMKFPIIRLLAMLKGLIQIIIVTILLFNIITAMTMKEAFC